MEIKLRNLRLTDSSKLLDHVFTIKNLCAKMTPSPSDGKIIFYILSSLPSNVSQTLTLLPHKTMEEFDASIKSYLARDSLLSLSSPSSSTVLPTDPKILSVKQEPPVSQSPSSKSKKPFHKKKSYQNSDKSNSPKPNPDDRPKDSCPICAGQHSKADCHIIVCRYCKSIGHYIFQCPQDTCKASKKNNQNFQ